MLLFGCASASQPELIPAGAYSDDALEFEDHRVKNDANAMLEAISVMHKIEKADFVQGLSENDEVPLVDVDVADNSCKPYAVFPAVIVTVLGMVLQRFQLN